MTDCKLADVLSGLKRSSKEAVANASKANALFHVHRPIEDELRKMLIKVNEKKNKCLLLLCGSSGDGKSYLLSYFNNAGGDGKNLLEGWDIINDGSQAENPSDTDIDTLANKLSDFNDQNYKNNNGHKLILGINLGTLNKFIESNKANEYTKLKEFVIQNGIISEYRSKTEYQDGSVFQYLSFSDYHMFSLTEKSVVKCDYLNELFKKVIDLCESATPCQSCLNHNNCPIRENFEFFKDPEIQHSIELALLQVEIKEKYLLSMRDILDFVYTIIIPVNYQNKLDECNSAVSSINQLQAYLSSTLPNLVFDNKDGSKVLQIINSFDPMKYRSEKTDEKAIEVHTTNNKEVVIDMIKKEIDPGYFQSIYYYLSGIDELDSAIRHQLFSFASRARWLIDSEHNMHDAELFNTFLKYLFYRNLERLDMMSDLYDKLKYAVLNWNGNFGENLFCIDKSSDQYWILEKLEIEPEGTPSNVKIENQELQRYSPVLNISLKKAESERKDECAEISIDYSLFVMIEEMYSGYSPTAHERNVHAEFDSFVRKIENFGSKKKLLYIKDKENGKIYKFKTDGFGVHYSFGEK